MKTPYAFMILSTIFYAINGTVDYVVIRHMPFGMSLLSISIGILAGVLAAGVVFGLRFRLPSARHYAFSAFSALMIVAYTVLILIAYLKYNLASIYPLIGLSAVVFFAIDYMKYHKSLKAKQSMVLLIGILLIVIGIFYAESNEYSFQLGTIPFIFGIAIFAGIGYYAQFYKIKSYSIGSKLLFQPIMLVPFSLLLVLFNPLGFSYYYFVLGLLGGFTFAFASTLELRAMKISTTRGVAKTVMKRNFINDFTYADTLLVLVGSIAIGSYYPIELLGAVFIVAGIVVIGKLQ